MKFTKSTRLALAIFFIYLSAFVELYQLESSLKLKLNSRGENSIQSEDKVETKHPLGNFLIGTFEGLGKNETGFYKCLPEKWKKEGKDDSQVKTLDKAFKSWDSGLQTFIKAGKKITEFFCKYRENAMNIISEVILKKSKKKKGYRTMSFLETRSGSRSRKFTNAYRTNYRAIMKTSKMNGIADEFFKTWFKSVTDKVNALVKSVKDFFGGQTFTLIKKAYDCILSLKKAAANVVKTIKGLKKKFDVLVKAASNQPLLVVAVIDLIIAFICNWKKFKESAEFFMKGLKEKNKKTKWGLYGKAVGTLFYAISTSKTLDLKKLTAIKSKIK